jgi:hypothetical protein
MSDVGTGFTGFTALEASGSRGFAITSDLAASTFTQLGQLQDTVGEMVRQAKVLGRSVPLGGGYAAEVGAFMAKYGVGGAGSAVESLTAFGKQLDHLKTQMDRALSRYGEQDATAADAASVDCSGG